MFSRPIRTLAVPACRGVDKRLRSAQRHCTPCFWDARHAEVQGRLAGVLLGIVLFFFMALAWGAEEASIAVVYPDIGEPYREIFAKIIEGIENNADTRVTSYPLRSDIDSDALKSSLRIQNTKVVIALGRQGMKFASTLDRSISVVGGAVLTVPDSEARGQSVISLAPDPALLFARLKAMLPTAKRVFVVYDPNFNGWLIKLARDAAHAQGLELVAYESHYLRGAVKRYQEIFSASDSRQDALWLPQDPTTVEEGSVLPLVLQESWNRNLTVFSSSFGHVQRGVLFSLYPDNEGLGKSLVGLARGILASGDKGKSGMLSLHDVQVAVNLRTAKHLGLELGLQQKSFDAVFPEQ